MTGWFARVRGWGCGTIVLLAAGCGPDHESAAASDGSGSEDAEAEAGPVTGSSSTGPSDDGCLRQLDAGAGGAFVVKSDGTLWTWGANTVGQRGLGTTDDPQPVPVQLGALGSDVVTVGAGDAHACAIREDGTAWCWGTNEYGQLGDGTVHDRFSPVQVVGLNDAVQIVSGGRHTCARKQDGTVWCWGGGDAVGDGGPIANRLEPVEVTQLRADVAQVSTRGGSSTCALETDGTLWCWGRLNVHGQIGDGTTETRRTPVQVTLLGSDVASVDVGDVTTCAVKTDGTLWCWGHNEHGQVGDGTLDTPKPSPVQVTALGDVVEVSAGFTTCARKRDGTVWCWGKNATGTIGDGTIDPTCPTAGPCEMSRTQPVQVEALADDAVEISVGAAICARKHDDSVWCWGANSSGAVGDGTTDGEPYSIGANEGVSRPLPTRALLECP